MKRSEPVVAVSSSEVSADYRRDCARAENEALETLRNLHMPVINIPAIRDISVANYKRRMVKCDRKIREAGIVLVAATDFVAACLSCPPLFGWNIDDSKEQVSVLLADLGRRWTRLLSSDRSRCSALLSLLETSLRCLGDEHKSHFQEAREVGMRSGVPELKGLAHSPAAPPKADVLGHSPVALAKADVLGHSSVALAKADVLAPNPKAQRSAISLSQKTLFSFLVKGCKGKPVAASDEGKMPAAHVFSTDRVQQLVDSASQIDARDEVPPPTLLANGDPLPLVNATNIATLPVAPSVTKPAANALLVMMRAAKENKRKPAAAARPGPGKRARR